jgi:hypothetical protein
LPGRIETGRRELKTEITRLSKNPYSLGLLARYVASTPPFSGFELGPSITTLLHQINDGTHLVASREDQIVGYLGWLRTTEEIARGWVELTGPLKPHPDATAIAVTILLAEEPGDVLRLIRAAKRAEPGLSVYWKRYFTDGRPPSARKVRKKS